jgi:hypothetical protein
VLRLLRITLEIPAKRQILGAGKICLFAKLPKNLNASKEQAGN